MHKDNIVFIYDETGESLEEDIQKIFRRSNAINKKIYEEK